MSAFGRSRQTILFGAAAIGVCAAVFLLTASFQDLIRRTLLLTTADPDALGLVGTESMEPISVGLHAQRTDSQTGDTYTNVTTIDEAITFEVPAAFVTLLNLKEGAGGSQRLGFSVWSETFEPYMRDFLAGRRGDLKAGSSETAHYGGVDERVRATGEYDLDFELSNYVSPTSEARQRNLEVISVPRPTRPCVREEIAAGELERITAPAEVKPSESCLETSFGVGTTHYVNYADDGTIRFAVSCMPAGLNRNGKLGMAPKCRLYSYFRIWPLTLEVRSDRSQDFAADLTRVQAFLESIVTAE